MADLDLVLFGATGFTGGLVAEQIGLRVRDMDVKWGLAGRNLDKLATVRQRLTSIDPSLGTLPLLEARSEDLGSLREMTGSARVVATTVGPYTGRGEPLVQACLETGTDYVDLAGEPGFWRHIVAEHHEAAVEKGVLVVPCCGFDSIPADLGVWFTLRELGDEPAVRLRAYVSYHGKMSGGTWASALRMMANVREDGMPGRTEGVGSGSGGGKRRPRVHFAPEIGRWGIPMPVIDPLVVKRSAAFSPGYPPDFRYEHYLQVRSLPKMAGLVAGAGLTLGLAQLSPTRKLLERLRPSGSGPDEEERARGKFRIRFIAEAAGRRIATEVSGGDPGYGHTAKMLTEAALTLVQDRDALPHRGGVLTPAAALTPPLFQRLRETGTRFDVLGPV